VILEIRVDGSMEILHVFFFLPILKKLFAMATNRLKHGKYNNICD
jgi:hypothetical protein